MGEQLPIADVEGLVVDEEPQELAVGDVDHRLPRLGIPEPCLCVGKRSQLVDAVQVGPGKAMGFPLVEVPPQSHVPVREGEDRLALAEQVEAQLGLPEAPWLHRVGRLVDHVPSSTQ